MSIVARIRRLTEEHGNTAELRWYTDAHRFILGDDAQELLCLPYDQEEWASWEPRLPYGLVGIHFFREQPERERAIFLRDDGEVRLVLNMDGVATTIFGNWASDRSFDFCVAVTGDDGEPDADAMNHVDIEKAFTDTLTVGLFFLFMRERGPQFVRRAVRKAEREDDTTSVARPADAGLMSGRTIVLPSIRTIYERHRRHAQHRSPRPHSRAGHVRRFTAARYKSARGREVWVGPMKVLGGPPAGGEVVHRVRFALPLEPVGTA